MGKKMRILFLNWRDIRNPDSGGAEVYIHEIAKRLVLKGCRINLFTASFSNYKEQEIVDGIEIIRQGNKYTVYLKAKRYYEKNFKRFDAVIDSINTVPFMTPRFVKKDKCVVTIIYQLAREFWFYETPFPISWLGYYWLENHWLKNYINIPTVTISNSSKDDLLDLGFKDVHIIPIGLNMKPLSHFPKKENSPTFIFVGRMGYAKCPNHILDAFLCIKKEISNAKLWMVGEGTMKKELQMLRIPDVTFFGYVDINKKYDLMSRAHVILVPGLREGWGLIVTEANTMGTPAVGYKIHGLRDSIKDNETGFLCDPTPESMAEKAIELIRNIDLRNRFSKKALEWSSEFHWDNSAEEFFKYINNKNILT